MFILPRSSRPDVFCKKVFLEISKNSQENTGARASFLIKSQACSFIKKDALAQVFLSSEFYEIFKNTFSYRIPPVAASVCLLPFKSLCTVFLIPDFSQMIIRSNHQRCSIEKGALKNLAKFTEKHLFQISFSTKLQEACNFVKSRF